MLNGLKQHNPTTWLEVQMGALRYKFDDYMEYYKDGKLCSVQNPQSYSDLNLRLRT